MKRLLSRLFGKRQPEPVYRLTMQQAMDISLVYGYNAVDWQRVI